MMEDLIRAHNRYTTLMEKRARAAFLNAVFEAAKHSDLSYAIDEIRAGKVAFVQGDIVKRLRSFTLNLDALEVVIRDTFAGGARVTAKVYGNRIAKANEPRLTYDFTVGLPDAVDWARSNAADMVTNINVATREAIKQRVQQAMYDGEAPWELAESLRDVIGLTPGQVKAVETYRQTQYALVSRTQANTLAKKYAKSLLSQRATVIARTEVLKASNAGQDAYWKQGIAEGAIDPNVMVRQWIATIPSERTCPTCGNLDEKVSPINGKFPGGYDMPPAHPQCRCTTGLVFLDEVKKADMLKAQPLAPISKMNPNHDKLGRFTTSSGGGGSVDFDSIGATWRNNEKTAKAKAEFDALPDDAVVTVYHGTNDTRATAMSDTGVVATPVGYKSDLPTKATQDLYVAPTRADAEQYGGAVVVIHARKGDLRPSPEAKDASLTTALFNSFDGAVIPSGTRLNIKKGSPMDDGIASVLAKYNPNHDRLGRFASGPGRAAAGGTSAKSEPHEVLAEAGIKNVGGKRDIDEYSTAAEARKAVQEWTDYTAFSVMSGDGSVRHFAARVTPAGKKVLAAKETQGTSADGQARQRPTTTNPKAEAAKPTAAAKPAGPKLPIPYDAAKPVRPGFRRVEDTHDRARLPETHSLKGAIPPAWTDVQVAVNPKGVKQSRGGSLVATGKDAKGRTQYLYSAEHSEAAGASKFKRIRELQTKVPKLDARLALDATKDPAAGSLLLMRKLGMRPGSDRATGAEKKAFGATNLEARHAKVAPNGKSVTFDFDSKKGGHTTIKSTDPTVIAAVKAHKAGKKPTDKLFTGVNEAKTDTYIKGVLPGFKQKDLRTLHGTALAHEIVGRMPVPKNATEAKRAKKAVATEVSQHLGNTPTVALNSYIAPEVFGSWE